jgi:membrane protein implicated in regulation of membrane protease activity
VYGGLTAVVVGVYVLIVGALGTLLSTDNVLISLVATGCVAVLFQPLRERLQRGANHLLPQRQSARSGTAAPLHAKFVCWSKTLEGLARVAR